MDSIFDIDPVFNRVYSKLIAKTMIKTWRQSIFIHVWQFRMHTERLKCEKKNTKMEHGQKMRISSFRTTELQMASVRESIGIKMYDD